MLEAVHDRAVSAARLAERRPMVPTLGHPEAALHLGDHLVDQEVLPVAHRRSVNVPAATEGGETVGEHRDDRSHLVLGNETIETLRYVLAERAPVEMRQP